MTIPDEELFVLELKMLIRQLSKSLIRRRRYNLFTSGTYVTLQLSICGDFNKIAQQEKTSNLVLKKHIKKKEKTLEKFSYAEPKTHFKKVKNQRRRGIG